MARLRLAAWNLRTRGRAVREAHGVGVGRQILQMSWFWRRLGTHDSEYYDYRLFDPATPLAEKLSFLSSHRWLQLQDVFNPRHARRAVNDKPLFHRALKRRGLPCPEELGVLHVGGARAETVAAELAGLLQPPPASGLVIKPASGTDSGRGILVFESVTPTGSLRHVDGTEWSLPAVAEVLLEGVESKTNGRKVVPVFSLERRLIAHRSLIPICLRTFCTCRVVTLLDGDTVHVLGATFKVAVGSLGIDNYSRGTADVEDRGCIAVFVDPDTGCMGQGFREFDDTPYHAHPHTGVRFHGLRLPCWEEALACVRNAAGIFPELLTLGWDVGFTDEGPVILEANPHWAEDLIQRPSQRGLWRPPLTTVFERIRASRQASGAIPEPAVQDGPACPTGSPLTPRSAGRTRH